MEFLGVNGFEEKKMREFIDGNAGSEEKNTGLDWVWSSTTLTNFDKYKLGLGEFCLLPPFLIFGSFSVEALGHSMISKSSDTSL